MVVRMRQSAQFVVCMCQQGLLYSSEGVLHFGQPVGMVVSVVGYFRKCGLSVGHVRMAHHGGLSGEV